jgi:hypothetical protein
VLDYLDNVEAISLWMTGSTLIRQRLGFQGGWKVLKVGGRNQAPFYRIWPRTLVNNLHGLSVLEVSPPHVDALLPMLKPSLHDLKQLPKSLSDLQFDFVDPLTDEWLLHLPPQLTRLALPANRAISCSGLRNLPPNLETLDLRSNLRILTFSDLPRTLLRYTCLDEAMVPRVNLSFELPNDLVSLKIVSKKKGDPIWNMSDLACLALHSSLTVLKIEAIGSFVLSNRNIAFPRSLTSLTLTGNPILEESDLLQLPPSLQRLQLFFCEEVDLRWSDASIGTLPRSLTHLEVLPASKVIKAARRYERFPCRSNLTPECISFLPSGMRVLKLHQLIPKPDFSVLVAQPQRYAPTVHRRTVDDLQAHFDVYAPLLPQGLVELSLRLVYRSLSIAPSLEHLPRSITNLSYMNLALKPNKMAGGTSQTYERISDLQIIFPPDFVPNPSVPPLLTSMRNATSWDDHYRVPTVISTESRFPGPFWFLSSHSFSNLRKLIWTYRKHKTESRQVPLEFYKRNPQIDSYCACDLLQALPKQLTTLDLEMNMFKDEDVMLLPDSLTELRLSVTPYYLSDECLPALPHNLTSFSIRSPHAIRGNVHPWPKKLLHVSLSRVGAGQNAYATSNSVVKTSFFQPKFPKYLQTLQLNCPNLSSNFLFLHGGAPPFLTSLVLLSVSSINPSILPMLPETLVRFEYPALEFYDEDVKFFPRSLRYFYSPNGGTYVTDTSASEWPPLLRELHVKGCLLTNEGIKKLPKTIEKLFLPYAMHVDQTSIRSCFGTAMQQWNIDSITGNNFH